MLQTISLFAPQLVLAFFASQLLSTGAFAKKDISIGIRYFAVGVLVLYAFIGFLLGQPTGEAFKGALVVDSYSHCRAMETMGHGPYKHRRSTNLG